MPKDPWSFQDHFQENILGPLSKEEPSPWLFLRHCAIRQKVPQIRLGIRFWKALLKQSRKPANPMIRTKCSTPKSSFCLNSLVRSTLGSNARKQFLSLVPQGTIAEFKKNGILRDFSNEGKKCKNGKLFTVNFLYFLSSWEKDPKGRLFEFCNCPLKGRSGECCGHDWRRLALTGLTKEFTYGNYSQELRVIIVKWISWSRFVYLYLWLL